MAQETHGPTRPDGPYGIEPAIDLADDTRRREVRATAFDFPGVLFERQCSYFPALTLGLNG